MHSFLGFAVIYICFISSGELLAKDNYVQRDTKQGALKGVIKTARNGDEYHAFLGIPYAQPPVDELRWEKPIPASSWEGVRDATENPNMCMQEHVLNPEKVEGSVKGQDCLFDHV